MQTSVILHTSKYTPLLRAAGYQTAGKATEIGWSVPSLGVVTGDVQSRF